MIRNRYVQIILITISLLISVLLVKDEYVADNFKEFFSSSNLYFFALKAVPIFCVTQFLFLIFGFIGNKIFSRKKTGHVIYPLNNWLVAINALISLLMTLVILSVHASNTGNSHLTLNEYLQEIMAWVVGFTAFSTTYILLFYFQIITIVIGKRCIKVFKHRVQKV